MKVALLISVLLSALFAAAVAGVDLLLVGVAESLVVLALKLATGAAGVVLGARSKRCAGCGE